MDEITVSMNFDQWRTVIDALKDKYPDSDCMDILTATIPNITEETNNENI